MNPRKLSDILAELVETHELLRTVKRMVEHESDRITLHEVDAHLTHAIADLKAADTAWEECDQGRKA